VLGWIVAMTMLHPFTQDLPQNVDEEDMPESGQDEKDETIISAE
jgi:hypothetical protein